MKNILMICVFASVVLLGCKDKQLPNISGTPNEVFRLNADGLITIGKPTPAPTSNQEYGVDTTTVWGNTMWGGCGTQIDPTTTFPYLIQFVDSLQNGGIYMAGGAKIDSLVKFRCPLGFTYLHPHKKLVLSRTGCLPDNIYKSMAEVVKVLDTNYTITDGIYIHHGGNTIMYIGEDTIKIIK